MISVKRSEGPYYKPGSPQRTSFLGDAPTGQGLVLAGTFDFVVQS